MTISISKIKYSLLLLPVLFAACGNNGSEPTPPPPVENILAFPGADGGGRYATGGRGRYVLVVNSLEDDPQDVKVGTLRHALSAAGARIVIFSVSGRIDLKGELKVSSGNVTVLGQSAPGDGICISGYPLLVETDNVILRFLRFRMGDEHGKEGDALTIEPKHKNIIVDHCSCSWSTDECLSVYGVENTTIQYCYITESLHNSIHDKGGHGYGGIWGGKNTSFHHNLLAHHDSRNPRFDHDYVTKINVGPTDFINNVVYNWGSNSAYGGESTQSSGNTRKYNFVNNYYKAGPITLSHCSSKRRNQFLNPTTNCSNCGGTIVPALFYMSGNVMSGDNNVTTNNWLGVHPDTDTDAMRNKCKASSPFSFTNAYTAYESAEDAFETVLAKGGCSFRRDVIDTRIAREVRSGTAECKGSVKDYKDSYLSTNGIIDTPKDAGGWPDYKTATNDNGKNYISDAWEVAHGFEPDGIDYRACTIEPPYMNIEVYLNDIVKDLYVK